MSFNQQTNLHFSMVKGILVVVWGRAFPYTRESDKQFRGQSLLVIECRSLYIIPRRLWCDIIVLNVHAAV